jgi:hypothetical protein
MIATRSANEMNMLTEAAFGNAESGGFSLAESSASDEPAEIEEEDDGVEPLIVCMDRTRAEHLFLHAQRHI